MADARKDRRTLLSLKIRFKSSTLEDFIERYSGDISRGGVFIKAKQPLGVGTLLKFEFMLEDQSTLIHGVGRVVWRREEAESNEANPPGMGIKFIKMDPESRSIVERIAEQRGHAGVFEHGKEGAPAAPSPPPELDDFDDDETTNVRHVSEFVTAALEEGGAGDAVTQEARAARGAFSVSQRAPSHPGNSISDAPTRGAISAFGGAPMTPAGGSGTARVIESVPPDDDLLESEPTKIRNLPTSQFPDTVSTVIAEGADALAEPTKVRNVSPYEFPDGASTVIAQDAAAEFQDGASTVIAQDAAALIAATTELPEKAQTPVAPTPSEPASSLDESVFDLPEQPDAASGERLEGAAPKVPPPQNASTAVEAFKAPPRPHGIVVKATKKRGRGWLFFLLFIVLLAAGAFVASRMGLVQFDRLKDMLGSAAPAARSAEEPVAAPKEVAPPTPEPDPQSEQPKAQEAQLLDDELPEDVPEKVEVSQQAESAAEATAAETAQSGMVKFQLISMPEGAFVSVNGKRLGRTPLDLEYEVGTRLRIYCKIRGYLARRKRITVRPGQEAVKLALSPLPYVVKVVTEPPGAGASAVGGGAITTPGELRFKTLPKSRKIVIAKDGYKTASTSVNRASFVEETNRMFARVDVTLKSEGPSKPEKQETSPDTASTEAPPITAAPPSAEVEAEPAVAPAKPEPAPAPDSAAPSEAKDPAPSQANDAGAS